MKKSMVPAAAVALLGVWLSVTAATTSVATPPAQTIPASGSYIVNNDHVNVRAFPDVTNGKVIAQLNKGAAVDVQEMTKLVFNVNGMLAAWFHLKSPNGWIFGWYLDPLE